MNKLFSFAKYLIPFLVTYVTSTFVLLNMQLAWAGCDCPENDAQSFVLISSALIASVFSVLLTYLFTRKINFWLAVLVSIMLSILILNITIDGNVPALRNQILPYFQK